jgi:hypothetical protein
MKYHVSTVLGNRDDFTISGDVFYINERKVIIAGVEHDLFYGDIVQHSDFSYYINEDSVSTKEFDNHIEDFWYMEQGEIPDDGKKYLFLVDPELSYEPEFQRKYSQFENKIISRKGKLISIHAEDYNRIFCTQDNKAYLVEDSEFNEYTEAYENFLIRQEEHEKQLNEQLVDKPDIVDVLIEKAVEKIDLDPELPFFKGDKGEQGEQGLIGPKGERGEKGPIGEQGIMGVRGPQGERGPMGPQGLPGLPGPQGIKGEKGEKGDRGLQGERGYEGPMGRQGAKGEKGDKGDPGQPGPIGEQGPPGPIGPQGPEGPPGAMILNEDVISGYGELKDQFKVYQQRDQAWKARLNIQLASLGGGGSAKILDNDDVVFNRPEQLSNNDVLIWDDSIRKFTAINMVTVINNIKAELEVQYDKLVDEQTVANTSYTYVGEAAPGSVSSASVWRIKRITEYANGYLEIIWANDTDAFDKVWNDRASYTYTV